jgi:predicted ATP-grasp superfamily ATP-dependent carboligase
MNILLTGTRAPAALEIARRLHAAGHRVYAADSIHWDIASSSRAVVAKVRVASVVTDPIRWQEQIADAVQRFNIDLWIPVCEEVLYAAHVRGEVGCDVFVDTPKQLIDLHDKWKFVNAGAAGNVTPPESYAAWSMEDIAPFVPDAEQWVFKPMYSRFATDTLIGPSAKELAEVGPSSTRGWVVQKKITGRELCTFSIVREGRLQAHVCYISKFRAGKGAGILFVPLIHEAAHDYVKTLVAKLNYTGMLGLDIIEREDGSLWPIEANPRATSGVHLLANVADFGQAWLGQPSETIPADPRSQMVSFAMPTWGIADAWRKRKLGEFLRDMLRSRDVVWRWGDPLPAFSVGLAMLEFALTARRRRISIHQATTWDLEWNGTGRENRTGNES